MQTIVLCTWNHLCMPCHVSFSKRSPILRSMYSYHVDWLNCWISVECQVSVWFSSLSDINGYCMPFMWRKTMFVEKGTVTIIWPLDFQRLPFRSHHDPDIKVREAYMGPTWGRQDQGGPHVNPMNLAICVYSLWSMNVSKKCGLGEVQLRASKLYKKKGVIFQEEFSYLFALDFHLQIDDTVLVAGLVLNVYILTS